VVFFRETKWTGVKIETTKSKIEAHMEIAGL